MRVSSVLSMLAASVLAFASATAAAEPACDPATFSADPADFAHLEVEDFQSFEVPQSWVYPYTAASPLMVDELSIYGEMLPSTGWCIPGMDSDWYASSCGGTNVYMASSVNLTIEPLVPTTQVAFDYGTQGAEIVAAVTLSDGSVEELVLDEQHPNRWGSTSTFGFFGYCTGSPDLTIVSIHLSGADGGIDNVRHGTSAPACDDADGDGYTTCDLDCDDRDPATYPGALEVCDALDNGCDGVVDVDDLGNDVCDTGCSTSSLRDALLALGLPAGLETALLAKVDAAEAKLAADQIDVAINNLSALVNQIEAQRGKKIASEDADQLLACIAAIIANS